MNSNRIGQVKKLVRYPVKSMAGVAMDEAILGWHGLQGDRRFGVRQLDKGGDFPWLTASKLPELLLYRPSEFEVNSPELRPTRVQSPSGKSLNILGDELCDEIESRIGSRVEVMALKHGIFDDAVVSVIASCTTDHVCREAGVPGDSRRFRANIEIGCERPAPFEEDQWVGGVLSFGENEDAPAVYVTKCDVRCMMIGLDPDDARHNPLVLKTVARLNENNAGVYGAVIRAGTIRVGDSILFTGREDSITVSPHSV